jgi:hypothetical protein
MTIEEMKKLMAEHPLERKDFDPYNVQMKIRVGFNKPK